jgi:hypothetical protein
MAEPVNGGQDGGDSSHDPDLAVDKEFLRIGDLGCAESSIRLQELVDTGHHDGSVVVGNELRSSSKLETILPAFPFRKGQVDFDFLT